MSFNVPTHGIYVPIAKDYVKYNSYENRGELVDAKLWNRSFYIVLLNIINNIINSTPLFEINFIYL